MLIPREVEHTILDTIEDKAITDIIDVYLEVVIKEAVPMIARVEIENEKNR